MKSDKIHASGATNGSIPFTYMYSWIVQLGRSKILAFGKKILQTMCSWRILLLPLMSSRDVWLRLNSIRPVFTSSMACKDAPPGGASLWPTGEQNSGVLELSRSQTSRSDISNLTEAWFERRIIGWKTQISLGRIFFRSFIL